MSDIPEGWTDDLSVPLPIGTSVEEVTQFVIDESRSKKSWNKISNSLVSIYDVSSEDADLILDRVHGGISRASTNLSENKPDALKDPFAFSSYNMAMNNKELIAFFYPDRVKKSEVQTEIRQEQQDIRPWWKFWK